MTIAQSHANENPEFDALLERILDGMDQPAPTHMICPPLGTDAHREFMRLMKEQAELFSGPLPSDLELVRHGKVVSD